MAIPFNPLDDENNTLAPLDTTLGGSAAGSGGIASSAIPSQAATGGPQTQQDVNRILSANQSPNFQPVWNPIEANQSAAGTGFSNATNQFNTATQDDILFDQPETDTLESVLGGSQSLQAGRDILSPTYGGPQGLDTAQYDPALDKFGSYSKQAQTPSGFNSLLSNVMPQSTAGERGFDTLIASRDPGARERARNSLNAYWNQIADVRSAEKTAADRVGVLRDQTKQMGVDAKDYVSNEFSDLNDTLTGRVSGVNQKNAEIEDFYNRLVMGNAGLDAAPAGAIGFDPSLAATQGGVPANPYYTLQRGDQPTYADVVQAPEAVRYNNASQLLGNADPTLAARTGYRGASIGFDATSMQAAIARELARIAAAAPRPAIASGPAAPVTGMPWLPPMFNGGPSAGPEDGLSEAAAQAQADAAVDAAAAEAAAADTGNDAGGAGGAY